MEIKPETKSLPRNRRCGNCRYFEPAPLWRKGWCRNPRLYDRRANHLVDATSINCEQVFRARIYWEPIPTSELENRGYTDAPRPAGFSADSGGKSAKMPQDSTLRPSGGRPVIIRRELAPDARYVKKQSQVRKWLIENIPYYDKIDGPIHSINYRVLIPWLIVVILLAVILVNLTSHKNKDTVAGNSATAAVTETVISTSAGATLTSLPNTVAVVPANSKTVIPTPTLSKAIATATPVPATPTNPATTQAKVYNAPQGLKMRAHPCTEDTNSDCKVVTSIPLGATVTITGGPVQADGYQWWPITFNGKSGYAASNYLQKISP